VQQSSFLFVICYYSRFWGYKLCSNLKITGSGRSVSVVNPARPGGPRIVMFLVWEDSLSYMLSRHDLRPTHRPITLGWRDCNVTLSTYQCSGEIKFACVGLYSLSSMSSGTTLLEISRKTPKHTENAALSLQILARSRNSAVGTATGMKLDDRGVEIRVPVGSRIFICPCRPDRLLGRHSFLSKRYWGTFPLGKAAGAWIWPLKSIYCRCQENVGLHIHSLLPRSVYIAECLISLLQITYNM
jgi:hypothetical protein